MAKNYTDCVFIIETDEKDPKVIAVAESLPVTVAEGYRVRTTLLRGLKDDPYDLVNKKRKRLSAHCL